MRRFTAGIIALPVLLSAGLWYRSNPDRGEPLEAKATAADRISEPIQPVPLHLALDDRKVELGKTIFHDARLSGDNTISCASCHNLSKGGVDGLAESVGINNSIGELNAPTVFNSGFNFKQFWDGRAASLEDQIDGPVHAHAEMGSNWPEIIGKLTRIPDYAAAFGRIYPDGTTEHSIKDALATFERSLSTPNAPFDRYLRGDSSAITAQEQEGYQLFKEYGCSACHQGINVGGNMFQKLGVMADYFAARTRVTEADMGRFNTTRDERDRQVFKVPTLRNIDLTAPYFHDGSAETLEEAVSIMAKYQLGRILSISERDLIVQFLKTLRGEYKGTRL